jgi:hypothetical protein
MSGIRSCVKRVSVALRSVLKPPAKVTGRTEKRCIWKLMMYADQMVWLNLDGLGLLDVRGTIYA